MKFLIIGSRGFIGAELMSNLHRLDIESVGSSRSEPTSSSQIKLLFDGNYSWLFNLGISHVIVTSAVTGNEECENNPQALKFNTIDIPDLIHKFLVSGIKVNYISSNTVFNGNNSTPNEYDSKDPRTSYAFQKSTTEDTLIRMATRSGCLDLLSITRLTKVVAPEINPFKNWLENIENSKTNYSFEDLNFAPITLEFAAENLIKITIEKTAGIFHLSGVDISYYEFLVLIYKELKISSDLLKPVHAISAGKNGIYLPRFSGLGMKITSSRLNIAPQPTLGVVEYICGVGQAN
jgi:dTDP-4-dehydrorhamnose reductase